MLDKVSANELVVVFMALSGVVLVILELHKRLGVGSTGRRLAILEKKVADIQKSQEDTEKGNRIIMKALLAIIPEGSPVKAEIQQYLLDK